jgi:hypothetical protein
MKHEFAVSEAESKAAFERVSKALLEHNARQGVNYWAGSAHPTMLLWAGRIFDFLRVLEEVVGHYPARMQSYLVGYKSGWDGATVSASFPEDGAEDGETVRLLSMGTGILAGAGWGRGAIQYDDGSGVVRWAFPEGTAIGLAARADGMRDKPACPFVAGFVAGWTNRSLGGRLEFQELECVAKGDARCVFESTPYLRTRAGDAP